MSQYTTISMHGGHDRGTTKVPHPFRRHPVKARLQANAKELNVHIVLAHASSAAIRLVTIEERLNKYNKSFAWRNYYDQKSNITPKDKPSYTTLLSSHRAVWLHILLRDNAAHLERGGKMMYEARQAVIESMTANEILNELVAISQQIHDILKAEKVLPH